MPRPKLSPLSSLLPQMGAATRPEPIAPAIEQASKPAIEEIEPIAAKHVNKQASSVTRHKEGSRSAVSFRMTETLQERLRLYAFETRRSKQDILDDALHEFLLRAGHLREGQGSRQWTAEDRGLLKGFALGMSR